MNNMPEAPVQEYLAHLPQPRRGRIEAIYARARALVPEATEGVKYAMPALVIGGRGLISVMSTKNHIGIYPYSGSVVAQFVDRLSDVGVPVTKGAIQLPDGVDLPVALLDEIVQARLDELTAQGARH